MRRRWAGALVTLLICAHRARVVILDDLGLLRQMQPSASGTEKKAVIVRPGGQQAARAPAMPSAGRSNAALKPQLPRVVAIQKAGDSPARNLLSRAPAIGRAISYKLGPSPQQAPSPGPLGMVAVPRRGPAPRRSAHRAESSSAQDGAPENARDLPEKTIATNTEHAATEDPRVRITTVVSYVSSVSSSRMRSVTRSSIDADGPAASSVNTSIPSASQPPTSSTIDDIPGRAEIDDGRLRDYVNDHNSNIDHANAARRSFLSMKIRESQDASRRNETKLASLRRIYDEYSRRMDELSNEMSRVRSSIAMYRALTGNTDAAIEELESGLRDNEAQRRLEEIELLRLSKEMNEEKNKIELLKEKSAMLKSRRKQMGVNESENTSKLQANEGKLGAYSRLAKNLENELRQLRENIDEVEALRRKDQDVLNKLEIEYNQHEGDGHWPLFVQYT